MQTRRAVGKSAGAAGFTLIEAMISMFFITFIVGEMAMVSMYAKRSTNYARRVTEANMIAEGVLEKARNAAYINLNTTFSGADNPPDPIVFDLNKDGIGESYNETCATVGVVTTCTATAQSYTITRTVRPYLPNTTVAFNASTAADIGIVVGWTDDRGAGHQVQVTTVRTKF